MSIRGCYFEEDKGMIKRTPQEIADFFQGYMAKDMSGCWHLYSYKPYIDDTYDQWYEEEREFDYVPFGIISDDDNTDWRESLCEPRMTNDTPGEEDTTRLVKMLSNIIIANMYSYEYTEDLKQIADHYGIKSQMQQLMEECAELSVEASHCIRGKGNITSLMGEIADIEIMIEQIKHLLRLDLTELCEIKKDKIDRQLSRIDEESADNPRKVHGKSANEEEKE